MVGKSDDQFIVYSRAKAGLIYDKLDTRSTLKMIALLKQFRVCALAYIRRRSALSTPVEKR